MVISDSEGCEVECCDPTRIGVRLCDYLSFTCWNLLVLPKDLAETVANDVPPSPLATLNELRPENAGHVLVNSRSKDKLYQIQTLICEAIKQGQKTFNVKDHLDAAEECHLERENKYKVNGQEHPSEHHRRRN